MRQNTQKDHLYRPDVILGAVSYKDGGLLILTVTTDDNRIGGAASSMTVNGESGGSGEDPSLEKNRRAPRQCFGSKENYAFGSNSSGKQGVNSAIRVYGQLCQTGVRRISWREIF